MVAMLRGNRAPKYGRCSQLSAKGDNEIREEGMRELKKRKGRIKKKSGKNFKDHYSYGFTFVKCRVKC